MNLGVEIQVRGGKGCVVLVQSCLPTTRLGSGWHNLFTAGECAACIWLLRNCSESSSCVCSFPATAVTCTLTFLPVLLIALSAKRVLLVILGKNLKECEISRVKGVQNSKQGNNSYLSQTQTLQSDLLSSGV